MKRRKRGSRLAYLVILALALSVALSSIYLREGDRGVLHKIKNKVTDSLSAPLTFLKSNYRSFSGWLTSIAKATELKKENEKLKEELRTARRLILEAEAIKRENEELREMLGVVKAQRERVVVAEVIAVNQELSGKFYLINKGKKYGVDVNQAVLTADGVFGKVYSAGNDSAVVIPINHPLSAVSARISETGELGILEGSVKGNLYLKLIPKESRVSIGMIVVTSGFGGVYPKNLLIGTIKKVKEDPNRLDLEIEVGPACDFNSVDFVIVITGKKK